MYIIEVKKLLERKNDELSSLLRTRNSSATFRYTMEEVNESQIVKPSKSYEEYTDEIVALSEEIMRLKKKLRLANESICENGQSIIDNIYKLKRLTAEKSELQSHNTDEKVRRASGYMSKDSVEYIEVNFDIAWLKSRIESISEEISNLQNVIDRANLTTEV